MFNKFTFMIRVLSFKAVKIVLCSWNFSYVNKYGRHLLNFRIFVDNFLALKTRKTSHRQEVIFGPVVIFKTTFKFPVPKMGEGIFTLGLVRISYFRWNFVARTSFAIVIFLEFYFGQNLKDLIQSSDFDETRRSDCSHMNTMLNKNPHKVNNLFWR